MFCGSSQTLHTKAFCLDVGVSQEFECTGSLNRLTQAQCPGQLNGGVRCPRSRSHSAIEVNRGFEMCYCLAATRQRQGKLTKIVRNRTESGKLAQDNVAVRVGQ